MAALYIHGTTTTARKASLLRRDGSTVPAEIWVTKVDHQPGKVSRLVFVVRLTEASREPPQAEEPSLKPQSSVEAPPVM